MKNETNVAWLSTWYQRQCDGDWEHQYGIKIDTLDNPGWHLSINLEGTIYEIKQFASIEIERSEDDWIHCFIRDQKFEGACGPLNLEELLSIFKNWIEE